MYLCDEGHSEIVYEERFCPLCELLKEYEELKNDYEKLIEELEKLKE